MSGGKNIVLIAGPTASGKSAAALALARAHDGVIVNADSMQVYAELSILTARPGHDDLSAAEHLLYGTISAAQPFSAAQWAAAAVSAIASAHARGKLAIVVGGTGLYFHVLMHGLSPVPPVPDDVRKAARQLRVELGAERFFAALEAVDREAATRLNPNDTQRVVRAYEVAKGTGKPLSEWQKVKGTPLIALGDAVAIVVARERGDLNDSINARFDVMMEAGAMDEVLAFRALPPRPEWPATRALGVRPLLAHLDGELTLLEAVERAKAETRAYAKRQATWFRHQMPGWHRVSGEGAGAGVVEPVLRLFSQMRNET